MKNVMRMTAVVASILGGSSLAWADMIDGKNWADEVAEYSSKIQNYGSPGCEHGTLMDPSTEWWLTGPSDADVNGNGYAWDWTEGDQDYVAGWKANAPDEYIVVRWLTGIPDVPGADLVVHVYGGPWAEADVLASIDATSYTSIGTIGGGMSGYFRDEEFDFAGLFGSDVYFLKLVRTANGAQTGMFFDSFAGAVRESAPIPEPATLPLFLCGVLCLGWFAVIRRKGPRRSKFVLL